MFDRFKSLFTKSFNEPSVFSNIAVLPFSKYKKNWGKTDFLNAYEISLYTNKALNKRAEGVGDIEFTLHRGENVVENHHVLDLLAKPSRVFTGSEFWALYQKYYDIFGEVYILLDAELQMGGRSRVKEMALLRSDMVKPFFDKQTGELVKIEHQTSEGVTPYAGAQVIYSRNPDPANPLRGESLLRSGIRQIETGTQIDEYQSKILENGGRVEGVFNFKTDTMNATQLKELKVQFQEEYGNASKAGLPLFLAGDASYDKLALSPAELAYLETKKMNLDDVAFLTGVPKSIMGVSSGETFSNSEQAVRVFLEQTINPLCKKLVNKLDETLVEDGLELDYVDKTPEDKEDKRKDLETAHSIHAMTVNEKREQLGLEPIEGGDVIMAPMNIVPMQTEEKEPTPVQEPEEKSIKINHPLRNKKTREIYHALQLKRLDRRQKSFENVIEEYFEGQKQRVIESVQGQKQFKKKDFVSEVFNTTLEIKLAKESVLPILEELLKEAAETSKEIAGSDWEFNETAEIGNFLDKKTDIFAKQINDTTFKKLKGEFAESFSQGETRQDLIKRIENTYGDITKARAATIARTEVHAVTQFGTLEGYKQAGLPIKIYVWAPGAQGGVRDAHQAMDGEEKPIDTAFSNGLNIPGEGPASEVINCQCTI